jgi:4-phytase/acid phosphatase
LPVFCAALVLAPRADPQSAATPSEELKYAVVVTRHGVRSPTWTPERLHQYSAEPWPDFGVAPGDLTPRGRELMKLMGAYYREYFGANHLPGFSGKPDCTSAGQPYFYSDTAQRTLVTAQALAETVWPGCAAEIHSAGIGKDGKAVSDPLFEGAETPDAARALAAVSARLGPKPDALADAHRPALDLLARVLRGNGQAPHSIFEEPVSVTAGKSGLTMNGPMSLASTLTEDLFLEYADGMNGSQTGWGRVDRSNLLDLMSLHTAYAELTRRTSYLARSRGSNLLDYIVKSLEQAATGKPVAGAAGKPATTLVFVSAHDTNISNLSGMLGLSWLLPGYQPDDAPPGGALVFTLWRSRTTGQYSVRLRYEAQTPDQMHDAVALTLSNPPAVADLFVPGCSNSAPGYPCEWASFLAVARSAIAPEFLSR